MPTDSTIPEAVTFPPNPPIGLSQQSLWTNFTQVCQELVQKNNRIKYLEEQVVNVGSALVHLQEDIKSQRKTVTFTIIKDVKEAYKVLGIEEKVSDDRLVDLLQTKFQFESGLSLPVNNHEAGAIVRIALVRKGCRHLQLYLYKFIKHEIESYTSQLGFSGVVALYSPDFDLPVAKPITFDTVKIEEARKILGITEKSSDEDIERTVSPFSPLSSFSLEQRGAVLAIWSKLSRSSCLDALKNSITNSEAETYLNKVIPLTPHRPINVLAAPHYSRNPITISQVKSLDAVNNIFGVGENFTWNEIENAFAGKVCTDTTSRGALLFLLQFTPSRFSTKERESLEIKCRKIILEELSSYLMNAEGIPQSMIKFYQKEIRIQLEIGIPLGEYRKQYQAMRQDIELAKIGWNELFQKLQVAQAATRKKSNELTTAVGELSRAKLLVEDLEKRLAKWIRIGEDSSRRIEELEIELDKNKQILLDKVQHETAKIDDLITALAEKKDEVGKLRIELDNSRSTIEELNSLLAQTRAQVEAAPSSAFSDISRGLQINRSDVLLQRLAAQLEFANEQLTVKTAENLELLLSMSGMND